MWDRIKKYFQKSRIAPIRRKYLIIGSTLIILISCIVLIYPFIPLIQYTFFQNSLTVPLDAGGKVHLQKSSTILKSSYKHTAYSLVIPEIGVNAPIGRGTNGWDDLNHGVWYFPESSTPDSQGMSVLLGHRFAYAPPSQITLYLLDKLKKGNIIVVYWNNKRYNFSVTNAITIPENKELQYITQKINQKEIALVTCTPLWSATDRLIVYAKGI